MSSTVLGMNTKLQKNIILELEELVVTSYNMNHRVTPNFDSGGCGQMTYDRSRVDLPMTAESGTNRAALMDVAVFGAVFLLSALFVIMAGYVVMAWF